jgi:hypothetical protein
MRHIALSDERRSGMAASTAPEPARIHGLCCPDTRDSGPNENVEFASLLPGGQTQGAGSGWNGSGDTSSPEPVIGYGATKGMNAYYGAILQFGSHPRMY